MKKNEYVAPQMETVELDGEAPLLDTSITGGTDQAGGDETPGGGFDGGAD